MCALTTLNHITMALEGVGSTDRELNGGTMCPVLLKPLSLRYLSLWAGMCLDITFTLIEISHLG